MNIREWCIAILKGKSSNMRFTELHNLCKKHYIEQNFDSEDELFAIFIKKVKSWDVEPPVLFSFNNPNL